MRWFRFYDEVLDDPKCQRLSAQMFRNWINVLCLANREPNRGTVPPIEDVAFGMRVSVGKSERILLDLVSAELLDAMPDGTFQPHGWDTRQRVSDDVSKRVSKYRAANNDEPLQETLLKQKRNVTETVPHARATEAETETETEKETGAEAPRPLKPKPKQPRPIHGPAQAIISAYCDAVGIDQPTSWDKAGGQAKTLVNAGVTAEDIPGAVEWCRSQGWLRDGFDLGTIVSQADKWRAAKTGKGKVNRFVV